MDIFNLIAAMAVENEKNLKEHFAGDVIEWLRAEQLQMDEPFLSEDMPYVSGADSGYFEGGGSAPENGVGSIIIQNMNVGGEGDIQKIARELYLLQENGRRSGLGLGAVLL